MSQSAPEGRQRISHCDFFTSCYMSARPSYHGLIMLINVKKNRRVCVSALAMSVFVIDYFGRRRNYVDE